MIQRFFKKHFLLILQLLTIGFIASIFFGSAPTASAQACTNWGPWQVNTTCAPPNEGQTRQSVAQQSYLSLYNAITANTTGANASRQDAMNWALATNPNARCIYHQVISCQPSRAGAVCLPQDERIFGLTTNTNQQAESGGAGHAGFTNAVYRSESRVCLDSPPPQPGTPNATPGSCGTGSITLSWSNVSGATGYQVQYRQGSGSWNGPMNAGSPLSLNGLTAGATYTFQVRATNGAGASPWSAFAIANAPDACPVPVGTLSGNRCTIPTGSSFCNGTFTWNITNASAPNLYNSSRAVQYTTSPSGSGASYQLRQGVNVVQVRNGSTVLNSVPVEATCQSGSIWNGSSCALSCAGEVTNVEVSGEDLYPVDCQSTSQGGNIGLPVCSNFSYSVGDTVTNQTDIQNRQCMIGPTPQGGGNCSFQTVTIAETGAGSCGGPIAPVQPVPPTITSGACGSGQLTATWSEQSGLTYDLQYRLSSGGSWTLRTSVSSGVTVAGLTPGASYDFQLRAENSAGTSPWSGFGGGTPTQCAINGVCGSRATSYPFSATNWPGGSQYCSAGVPSLSPAFPAGGSSVIWECYGQYGGTDSGQCVASRAADSSCGTAAGGTYTDQPTSNLCAAVTPTWSDTTGNDGEFNWSCGPTACTALHEPNAPVNLSASVPSTCNSTSLTLDWDDVFGATSYSVYFSDGTWVANTIGSDLSSFTGISDQTYEFYVRANSPLGVQSTNSAIVNATLPPVCSPTASLEVSINGGPFTASNPPVLSDTDTIDLQWDSTDASACFGTGPGFSTGSGNATSGIDGVDRPARGTTEAYEVNCDGATASFQISTAYPNLRPIAVTPLLTSAVDPSTGAYRSLRIRALIREMSNMSGTANSQGTIDLNRGNADTYASGDLGNPLNLGPFDPGLEVPIEETFSNVLPGEHRVRVSVDITNTVDEGSGESDNVREFVINVALTDPNVQITVDPDTVRPSGQVDLSWDADIYYPDLDCNVSGPGGIDLDFNITDTPRTLTTPEIEAKSVYTLTCTHPLGGPFTDQVEVETVGSVEEV